MYAGEQAPAKHRLLPSPRLLLSLTPGPRCLPLGAQPASAQSLTSSHGQQEQRLGVCGPGPRRCTEPPFTPRPARWAGGGCGARGKHLRVLRVATVSPLTRRDDTESLSVLVPTWPPSRALCPYTLAPGQFPGLEEGCPFIYSAANSAKASSAHVGPVTQRKRKTDGETKKERQQSPFLMNKDCHSILDATNFMQ